MSMRFFPDRQTIWRWHFMAGLLCLPFVALLSVTGSLYLFKPQIEAWIDRPYAHLADLPPRPAHAQVEAALGAMQGASFLAYEMPRGPHSVVSVMLDVHGIAWRVYVDPGTLHILKAVREDRRFERLVFALHGQLLLGNAGSVIIEMVASWTFVLIVTGCALWWPRDGARPVLWPRRGRGRAMWRDLHAVSGMWISLVLAGFLVTGLPWSFVWGNALARVEHVIGADGPVRGWEIGAVPASVAIADAPPADDGTVPGMADMPGMDMPGMDMAQTPARVLPDGFDRVVRRAATLGFAAPVLVTPPSASSSGAWRVRSDTQDRPRRIEAHVASDGRVLGVLRFGDRKLTDRLVGYGVAVHEGHLFGWANQVLNLVVAVLLAGMSIAACAMWWKRRPPQALGVPRAGQGMGVIGVAALVLAGCVLPELAASLLLLWVGVWAMGRRRAG